MDEVMKLAVEMGAVALDNKDIRNGLAVHRVGINGPKFEDIDPDLQEAWIKGADGHAVGLSAPFARAFQEQGGRGRSPLSLLEIKHQTLPKDENGFSLIGRIAPNGMFEPNPETIGLFGSYMPVLSDKHNHELNGTHGSQSMWEVASPQQEIDGNPRHLK